PCPAPRGGAADPPAPPAASPGRSSARRDQQRPGRGEDLIAADGHRVAELALDLWARRRPPPPPPALGRPASPPISTLVPRRSQTSSRSTWVPARSAAPNATLAAWPS